MIHHLACRMALAAAAAMPLLLSGCGPPTAAQSADAARESRAAHRVAAAPAERTRLQRYTTQPAWVAAYEEAPLYSKIAGYVHEVLVDIGQRVTQGQPLVRLHVPEMDDELKQMDSLVEQAAAQVRQARAAVAAADAAVRVAEARVREAEAGIGRAEGELARWQAEEARIRSLASSGSVTEKLLDETVNQLRAAEAAHREALARVESARAAQLLAEAGAKKARSDLAAARAQQRVAEAGRQRTQSLLNYATITAPFDGVIVERHVDRGHYVQPAGSGSAEPLLVVCNTDKVRVFADVPETEAPLVDAGADGDPVVVRVASLNHEEFPGHVTRTSWSLDSDNRSLRVEVDLDNPQGRLRPGMYATCSILLAERESTRAVPISAIVQQDRASYCWCVVGGALQRKRLELGLRCGSLVEVHGGLADDDLVVRVASEALQEGLPVEVIAP